MSESVTERGGTLTERSGERSPATPARMAWETPHMEDVSEQVMAQPYIRFT